MIMLKYLQAKQSASLGNLEPIKIWWQQRAARSSGIAPTLNGALTKYRPTPYDPKVS